MEVGVRPEKGDKRQLSNSFFLIFGRVRSESAKLGRGGIVNC